MGFEKAIESGKEHRKKYYDSRAFDHSCRNHGDCPVCNGNRLYQIKKEKQKAKSKLKEYLEKK